MITRITAPKNSVIAARGSFMLMEITYPATRHAAPIRLRTIFAFGSRSGADAPFSISIGFDILIDNMFFIKTSAKTIAKNTAVCVTECIFTSKAIIYPAPIIFVITIKASLLNKMPTPRPIMIDILELIMLSATRTLPRWRFSIPRILYSPNSLLLCFIKKLLM